MPSVVLFTLSVVWILKFVAAIVKVDIETEPNVLKEQINTYILKPLKKILTFLAINDRW